MIAVFFTLLVLFVILLVCLPLLVGLFEDLGADR